MSDFLNVSSSPHGRSGDTTSSIMFDVAIALVPATVFGIYWFKLPAVIITLLSVITAILTEFLFEKLTHQKVTITDGSALVTGLLLALNLSPEVPWWIPIIGSVFAILFVKQLFGGLGQNFMNPALAARCFLLISFAGTMSTFSVDGVTGPTPLAELKAGNAVNVVDMFLGFTGGTIGEVSTLAILIGPIYLVLRKVITLWIPISYIGSFAIFVLLFSGEGLNLPFLAAELCGGGLMLGAFFMATDYVTSPITRNGKIVFGILIGILTGVFRLFGPSAEGVSYAIILGNITVPLIERVTMPTAFGYGKKKGIPQKEEKGSQKQSGKQIDAVKLFVITLLAGLILGGVYQITKTVIAENEYKAKIEAYQQVCPGAVDFVESDEFTQAIPTANAEGMFSDGTLGNVVVNEALVGVDAAGNPMGYVVNASSNDGYGGEIALTVGFNSQLAVNSVQIMTINETAGLGMRAQEPEFTDQFKNKAVEQFTVTKTGSQSDSEINALSGATVTSNAVTNAVNAAIKFIQEAQNITVPSENIGTTPSDPATGIPESSAPEMGTDPSTPEMSNPVIESNPVTPATNPVVETTPVSSEPAATTPAAVNAAPVE